MAIRTYKHLFLTGERYIALSCRIEYGFIYFNDIVVSEVNFKNIMLRVNHYGNDKKTTGAHYHKIWLLLSSLAIIEINENAIVIDRNWGFFRNWMNDILDFN